MLVLGLSSVFSLSKNFSLGKAKYRYKLGGSLQLFLQTIRGKYHTRGRGFDRFVQWLLCAMTIACAMLLVLIMAFLLLESLPALREGRWLQFFTLEGWYPLEQLFGLAPMLTASLLLGLGSLALALPLGLLCALFIQYYAPPKISAGFHWFINLLAGIPSVVFGLWGLTQLVPILNRIAPPGASLLAGILVLTLMILPTVTLTSLAALRAQPKTLMLGAIALGMRKHVRIVRVIIPSAWRGIIAGGLLALARALGETMAVIMVAGNVVQFPASLMDPVRAMTANIALEMAYAMDFHRAGLFVSGFLLTLLVLIVAGMAARITGRSLPSS